MTPSAIVHATLRNRFEKTTPELDPKACLNLHHRGAACEACCTGCPTAAIHLAHGEPRLAAEQCIGCGLCQVVCPTDAWRQTPRPEQALVETARGLSTSHITLVCSLHPQPNRPALASSVVVRHRRCLASLGLHDLLALCHSAARTIQLDGSPCTTCPLHAEALLRAQVSLANDLLVAFNRLRALVLATDALEQPDVSPTLVIDGARPRITRRALFTTLRTRQDPAQTPRSRLLAALPQCDEDVKINVPPAAPFAQVDVASDRCSACGLCTRFCPTGALTWRLDTSGDTSSDTTTEFSLDFHAARCIRCPICTLACPEGAITLSREMKPASLRQCAPPNQLAGGSLVPCAVCGMLTAATSDSPRCHVCRQSAGRVSSLHDEIGLIADLFSPRSRGNENTL